MARDLRELRTSSQSWPPGFFVGSVALHAGARSRRRDGLGLIALAVCGWCLGYAITDGVCDSNRKLAAASAQAERDGVAGAPNARSSLKAIGASVAASAPEATRSTAAHASEAAGAADVAAVEGVASAALAAFALEASPLSAANTAPRRVRVAARSRSFRKTETHKLTENEEPSPVVSPEELNKALTLAAATKKIFASLDEVAQTHALPPSAAEGSSAERAALIDKKLVAIEALTVEGGVPSQVVSRGVQRLLPQYDRCRAFCDTEPQRMKLSATIDEAGRGRQVTVEGLSRPGLRRCLEQATAHLVVPAPDTGTARARWIVRFASRTP